MNIKNVSTVPYIERMQESQQFRRRQRMLNKEEQLDNEKTQDEQLDNSLELYHDEHSSLNFNSNLTNIAKQYLQSNPTAITNDFNQELLEDFASKYLENLDIKALLKYFGKNKVELQSLDELCENLELTNEIEHPLALFLKNNSFSNGEIYIILSYLLEYFKLKKLKNKQNIIANLLQQLEEQESAYLFEFFKLTNATQENVNPTNIDAIAKLESGQVKTSSLLDVIDFITTAFNGEFNQIVTNCLKHRLTFLQNNSLSNLNSEEKNKLSEYLQFEKYIIIIHSIYLQTVKLVKYAKDNDLELAKEDYSAMLRAVINFAKANFISELSFNNMIRELSINTFQVTYNLVTKIINVFQNMPFVLYNEDNTQQQKILEGLRQQSLKYVKDEVQNTQFSFLNPKKNKIIYRG